MDVFPTLFRPMSKVIAGSSRAGLRSYPRKFVHRTRQGGRLVTASPKQALWSQSTRVPDFLPRERRLDDVGCLRGTARGPGAGSEATTPMNLVTGAGSRPQPPTSQAELPGYRSPDDVLAPVVRGDPAQ